MRSLVHFLFMAETSVANNKQTVLMRSLVHFPFMAETSVANKKQTVLMSTN